MNVFWTAAANGLILTLPYRILCYYPFRDRLRFPVWVTALLIGVSETAEVLLYAYAISMDGSGRIAEFSMGIICMVIYFSCIRADKFKLLFLYLFVMDYVMIVRGLAVFVEARLFYKLEMNFASPVSILLHLAVFSVTVPFMLLFLNRTKERIFSTEAPVFWHTIWMIPALTSLIVLMFTGVFTVTQVAAWRFVLVRLFLLLCIFVVYYILLQSLDTIRQEAASRERAEQQAEIIALQRRQYEHLKRHIEETRQARHDLRQHLQVIQGYLDKGGTDELRDYITAYGRTVPADTLKKYCENYAVDVVLRYYAEEAEQCGIEFDSRICLPKDLPVCEPEFCALFGNLLENAVDACRKNRDTAAFIRTYCSIRGKNIVLTMDNTCVTKPKEKNGRFFSGKHTGYGLGTQSVCSIASRYGGIAQFSCQDGVFCVSVLLPFPALE